MSSFEAKVHQIRFRLWFAPDPAWGGYGAPPDSLAKFEGLTSKREETVIKGRESGKKERKGKERSRKKEEEGRRGGVQ